MALRWLSLVDGWFGVALGCFFGDTFGLFTVIPGTGLVESKGL